MRMDAISLGPVQYMEHRMLGCNSVTLQEISVVGGTNAPPRKLWITLCCDVALVVTGFLITSNKEQSELMLGDTSSGLGNRLGQREKSVTDWKG